MSFRGPSRQYKYPTDDTSYLQSALERQQRSMSRGGTATIGTDLMRLQTAERTAGAQAGVADRLAREERRLREDAMLQERNAASLAQMDATAEANKAQFLANEDRKAYGEPGQSLRDRLAAYVQRPSRAAAVEAVRAGADLNKFPDRFAGEPGYQPLPGTSEWFQGAEQELAWKARMQERYGAPPAPPQRNLQRFTGGNGNFWQMDPVSGQMRDTGVQAPPQQGAMGAGFTPQGFGGQGAAPGAAAPQGRPFYQPTKADEMEAEAFARDPEKVRQLEQQSRADLGMDRESQGLSLVALMRELRGRGLSERQVYEELRRQGYVE
jgi:hypothetical protein